MLRWTTVVAVDVATEDESADDEDGSCAVEHVIVGAEPVFQHAYNDDAATYWKPAEIIP